MSKEFKGFFTPREELLHGLTHGVGVGLSLVGGGMLVVPAFSQQDPWRMIGFTIYGATLFILYLASTLYHSVTHLPAKRLLRIADHSAIYLFIAGTYTPFILLAMRNITGWIILGVVWTMATAGIFYKIFFIHRYEFLSTIMYLIMGWLGVFVFTSINHNLHPQALTWLLIGGIFYTVGVIFYALTQIRYTHAIWHLFVLGGSLCHYIAVWLHH